MQDSIFTKIIKGEIPCHKIYEDERTIAFLDIHPVTDGMTVVVSKNQVEHFEDLPDADYTALWQTVRKIARRLRQIYPNSAKITARVEGIDVPHAHVTMFPFDTAADLRAEQPTGEPDHAALAALAEKLRIA